MGQRWLMQATGHKKRNCGAYCHISFVFLFCAVLALFTAAPVIDAANYSSTNFTVQNPVLHQGGGGQMSSTNFRLYGSVGQIAVGTSSASSFQICSGFLCFPAPAAGAASAAAAATAATTQQGGGVLETFLKAFNRLLPRLNAPPQCPAVGDFNCDGKVDLRDLSIFLYLIASPSRESADLNHDGKTDTGDLSILLSRWTGPFLAFVPERSNHLAVNRVPLTESTTNEIAAIGEAPAKQSPFSGPAGQPVPAPRLSENTRTEESLPATVLRAFQKSYAVISAWWTRILGYLSRFGWARMRP